MTTFLLAFTFASTAGLALAAPINLLVCNTGVSNCATQTPITTLGQLDPNFRVTLVPSGTNPTADTYFASPYYHSGTNPLGTNTASWITTEFGGVPTEALGTFNYQEVLTTGNFAGTVPVAFSGNWATDNCGTIAWGIAPVAVTGGTGTTIDGGVTHCETFNSAFSSLTAFHFSENVSGNSRYQLDFEVGNTGLVTGLLVDNLSASGTATAAPEPSSVILFSPTLIMLGLRIRGVRCG